MSFIEGRGLVAPEPVMVTLSPEIVGECRRWAMRRQEARGYAARADGWGKGYHPSAGVVGEFGQEAAMRFINGKLGAKLCKDDKTIRPGGDGGIDFVCLDLTFQVKTRHRGRDNLVKRVDDDGRLCPLVAEYFVFCKLETEPAEEAQEVSLLGWLDIDRLEEFGVRVKSTRDEHHNLKVEEHHLQPMGQLVRLLNGLRG